MDSLEFSPWPDRTRVDEHLNRDMLEATTIGFVGVGGAAEIGPKLAGCGVTNFIAIDPDQVSATNLATQGYTSSQVGEAKVEAFKANILAIDPRASVACLPLAYEDIPPEQREDIWRKVTIMLGMTDRHATQKAINRDALRYRKPVIFAMMGDGLQQMEITATLPETVEAGRGCFLCQVWPREKAYREGFENRQIIGSHVVSAGLLNAQIAYVVLGLLHHMAGSEKRVAKIGAEFAASPCLLTSLDPDFWAANPEGYGIVPSGMQLFTTKLFGLDSPKGWVCEACGTEGVA